MTSQQFESAFKTQPFVPVRIHMSNGLTHVVRHPDDAIIGDEVVAVGVYENCSDRPRIRLLSLINVNEIEPVSSSRP